LNYKYPRKKVKADLVAFMVFFGVFRVEERRTTSQNILQNEPCLSNPVIERKQMKSTAHEQTIIFAAEGVLN
jgi:hypothetical protein